MQISMACKYAIRAVMHLASLPFGSNIPINQISPEWEIPENYLRKIIPLLAKAGILYSKRGTKGGIELANPAENITFLDVIEAVEGKIFLNKCLMSPEMCDKSPWCAANLVWNEAQDKMKEVLSSKTFAELAEINDKKYNEFLIEPDVMKGRLINK